MISTLTLSMALFMAGRRAPEPPPEPQEPPATERWYSIHLNERHVGYVRMDVTRNPDGTSDFIADFTVQSSVAIPEINMSAGEDGSRLISYAYEAHLNDKFEVLSAESTVSASGMVVEARISRAEDRWSIVSRLADGTQRTVAGMVRTRYFFFYEALLSKAADREFVTGSTVRFEEIGYTQDTLFGLQWSVRVGDRVSAEVGPHDSVDMINLEMQSRPPGSAELLTVSVQVDAEGDDRGRICTMRYPVEGGIIVLRWEPDAVTANNGLEPFARDGRGDPFHRGLARRMRIVVPPATDDVQLRAAMEAVERLERDFLAANAEGRDEVMERIWIELVTMDRTYAEALQNASEEQVERLGQVHARIQQAISTVLGVWDVVSAIRAQFDNMYDQAVAMLNAEAATAEDPLLEDLLQQMQQIAADRRLAEHPDVQAQLTGQLEMLRDRRTVARLQSQIRNSRPRTVLPEDAENPDGRRTDPFVIEGFVLALEDDIVPIDFNLGVLGGRIDWNSRIRVFRPEGQILITGMIYREGMTVDLGIGEPLEIYRIETDRVIFRAQGRLEIPIPYPVGGTGLRQQAPTGGTSQGGSGR